jgi:peptide deformylase
MPTRPLRYLPDQILRRKAVTLKPQDLKDPAVQRLIDDMIESMHAYQGVGIAANQVGARQRICIIQLPDDEEPQVLVNPRITRRKGEREVTEGCLSLPGYQGTIFRSEQVWAKALDRHGNSLEFKAVSELQAQALEHEMDHLNGVAYVDHLRSSDDLYPIEEKEDTKASD